MAGEQEADVVVRLLSDDWTYVKSHAFGYRLETVHYLYVVNTFRLALPI